MRRYHRWLSVVFGLFLLWIAVTGVMSQFAALVANGGFEKETMERGAKQTAAVAQAIVPPVRAHEHEDDAAQAATPAAAAAAKPFVSRPT